MVSSAWIRAVKRFSTKQRRSLFRFGVPLFAGWLSLAVIPAVGAPSFAVFLGPVFVAVFVYMALVIALGTGSCQEP